MRGQALQEGDVGKVDSAVVAGETHRLEGKITAATAILRQVDGKALEVVGEVEGVKCDEGVGVGGVCHDASNDVGRHLGFVAVIPCCKTCHQIVKRYAGAWRNGHGESVGWRLRAERYAPFAFAVIICVSVVPRLLSVVHQPRPSPWEDCPVSVAAFAIAFGKVVAEGLQGRRLTVASRGLPYFEGFQVEGIGGARNQASNVAATFRGQNGAVVYRVALEQQYHAHTVGAGGGSPGDIGCSGGTFKVPACDAVAPVEAQVIHVERRGTPVALGRVVVLDENQMVTVVLVSGEIYFVAAPHVVALGDGVYRHKAGSVARVVYQSYNRPSITVLLAHKTELEAGIAVFFDIGQRSHGDISRITLQVDGVVAAIVVTAAAVVTYWICPAFIAAVVVACLKAVAPVGADGLAVCRKAAADSHAGSPIQLVAIKGTGNQSADIVWTADVAVGRGVGVVDDVQVHIFHRSHGSPFHCGTIAANAIYSDLCQHSFADNQVVQIAEVTTPLAVGVVPSQGYGAPRACISCKAAAVLFPHVAVRYHGVHRHKGAFVCGVVHYADFQYAAAVFLAIGKEGQQQITHVVDVQLRQRDG